jgi:hypothetical protein
MGRCWSSVPSVLRCARSVNSKLANQIHARNRHYTISIDKIREFPCLGCTLSMHSTPLASKELREIGTHV